MNHAAILAVLTGMGVAWTLGYWWGREDGYRKGAADVNRLRETLAAKPPARPEGQ